MPPPKAAKGEYIETVSIPYLTLPIETTNLPTDPKQKNPYLTHPKNRTQETKSPDGLKSTGHNISSWAAKQ